jgi:hypothetical protein
MSWGVVSSLGRFEGPGGSARPYRSIRVPRVFLFEPSSAQKKARLSRLILPRSCRCKLAAHPTEYTRDAYAPVRRHRSTWACKATQTPTTFAAFFIALVPKPTLTKRHSALALLRER